MHWLIVPIQKIKILEEVFDVEYDDLCENINLNLGGYFLTTQIFCKFFKKQGFGNIVNLSSIYGLISPKFEMYENTK